MKKFFATSSTDYGMVLLRVGAGLSMLPYGFMKVGLSPFGAAAGGTIQYFAGMGIPAFVAVLVMIAETIGAISLVLGFCTRFCAAALAVIMVGAIVAVHGMGFVMGAATPTLFLIAFLVLTINGAGAWSADGGIAKNMR